LAVTAGIGRQRFARCSRAFPSSARNDTWSLPDAHRVRMAGVRWCTPACGEAQLVRGGRPRRANAASGGAVRARCSEEHPVSGHCRGRSGLLRGEACRPAESGWQRKFRGNPAGVPASRVVPGEA
jgi:hypothetical protein